MILKKKKYYVCQFRIIMLKPHNLRKNEVMCLFGTMGASPLCKAYYTKVCWVYSMKQMSNRLLFTDIWNAQNGQGHRFMIGFALST